MFRSQIIITAMAAMASVFLVMAEARAQVTRETLPLKRLFSFLALSLLYLTAGCAELTLPEREEMFGSNPPRIVKADAQSKMLYPNSWTIFLHAEDPDGDLTGFAGWVGLLGGPDQFYTVPLNTKFRREAKGYVWVPLSPAAGHVFNTVTVTIYAKDKAGHKSVEKVLNLDLGDQLSEEEASKIQAYKREFDIALGPINIEIPLREGGEPGDGGDGGGVGN